MGVSKELSNKRANGGRPIKAAEKTGGFEITFINFELTERHKSELRDFAASGEISWSDLDTVALAGYSVKIGQPRDGQGYTCTFTDTSPTSAFKGYALSGRGATPFNAFASCYYKHQYALSGDWSNATLPTAIDFG